MTVFWNKIMDRFNATNLSLQKVEISLCESRQLYTSLTELVGSVRNEFDAIESEAKALVNGADYRSTRTRPRKRQLGESVEGEVQLTQREAFRINTFIVICDKLQNELNARQAKYTTLAERFDVFHRWYAMQDSELRQAATTLRNVYQHDLEPFGDEFVQMKQLFMSQESQDDVKNPGALLRRLVDFRDTFPNVIVALRIYLTLPSSNAGGERSFSCLKRVKNYLRSTLSQDKVDSLALLCIEAKLSRSLSFDSVIHQFATAKARKKSM